MPFSIDIYRKYSFAVIIFNLKISSSERMGSRARMKGFRTYYNFIRPYMSLNGKTPAEASGIDLELGKNKWLSLIKQAEKRSNPTLTTLFLFLDRPRKGNLFQELYLDECDRHMIRL